MHYGECIMTLKRSSTGSGLLLLLLLGLLTAPATAQVAQWKLGGSGLAWSESDTTRLFIDFDRTANSIQPIYLKPERTVFSHLDSWVFWRDPSDIILEYVEGETPRMWKWVDGLPAPNGSLLIDGDSSTYYPPRAVPLERETYTVDLGVAVPAISFGFSTPSQGFRSDGTPLQTDAIPGYDISIASTPERPVVEGTLDALSQSIANVDENFTSRIAIPFPRQYVRFVRYRRRVSALDEGYLSSFFGGQYRDAPPGTLAEFQLFAQGVPRQVIYKTRITSLGQPVNLGRLFWHATALRLVDGTPVETPGAAVRIKIEARTGRDDDPAVYHEYMETGFERVVSREHYEKVLRTRQFRPNLEAPIVTLNPRPGLRASIGYDDENWTFWSVPFSESGLPLGLRSGSYLQLRIALESQSFDDFIRLDSLWIETAALLAAEIVGEVARLDDPQPARGFAEVSLGEATQFVYDVRADFDAVEAAGFDGVHIRTGSQTSFHSLEIDGRLENIEASDVIEEQDGLFVRLPARIHRGNNPPLRLVFSTALFSLATTFSGEVLDSEREGLPQPIVAGDVNEALSTNSLRVLAAASTAASVVQDLNFSTPVLTPNGDGVHDYLRVHYTLFRLPELVPVTLNIFALNGRKVAQIEVGLQTSGPREIEWDGRDQRGQLLAPGLYLLGISPNAELINSMPLRPLGIAY
ncbi:MAG: hypothetical protein ACI906_003564 [Candidatus Latescibacterota bacterium]|jgi:hypothetical protein